MRTIQVSRFGDPDVLVPVETDEPRPAAAEVLIDVSVVEVLFLDTQLRAGWGRDYFSFEPPYVPGTGVGGIVTEAGDDHGHNLIGRRVVARTGDGGAYAEKVAVPSTDVFEVPPDLRLAEALAALHDAPTALSLLDRAAIQPDERVLVTAAGGSLASWLVPLARAAGAYVVAAARGKQKLERARELGADAVIDYDHPDWVDDLRRTVPAVDVVFDGAGGAVGTAAYESTADGARFFSYGAASGDFATIDPADAVRRNVAVIPIMDPSLIIDHDRHTTEALRVIADGTIRPAVGALVAFEDASQAHRAIEERRVSGKTVLQLTTGDT